MSLEFFYTKKLKALVEKLRAEKSLDETALANIDAEIKQQFIGLAKYTIFMILAVAFFASVSTVSNVESRLLWAILFLFICGGVVDVFLTIQKVCNKYAVLVTGGEKVIGKIIRCVKRATINETRRPRHWRFLYEFKDTNGALHTNKIHIPAKFNGHEYMEKDSINILYEFGNPDNNIPALPILLKTFDLKIRSAASL